MEIASRGRTLTHHGSLYLNSFQKYFDHHMRFNEITLYIPEMEIFHPCEENRSQKSSFECIMEIASRGLTLTHHGSFY